jgi:uncharacterized protein (TIGR00255 family)
MRSMTGYGRADAPLAQMTVTVELRSVNARFLDVRVRMPRDLGHLETSVRALVARFFKRGQIDVSIRLRGGTEVDSAVEVDLEAATRYLEGAERLRERLGLAGVVEMSALLALPGVAKLCEPEVGDDVAVPVIMETVERACAEAGEMREREGSALEIELRQRLQGLEGVLTEIEDRAEEVEKRVRERLERRLAALAPELEVDPARLAQEVVFYADRMDITEETVRLRSHVSQFKETLQTSGPVGRKLEFLLQEIGREVNTIGSKAADAPLSHFVVELKTGLEKLREQVLNLE